MIRAVLALAVLALVPASAYAGPINFMSVSDSIPANYGMALPTPLPTPVPVPAAPQPQAINNADLLAQINRLNAQKQQAAGAYGQAMNQATSQMMSGLLSGGAQIAPSAFGPALNLGFPQ
jgi:hypothetical protein